MNIQVNDNLRLELWNDSHADTTFELIENNRLFLRQWLAFVDNMQNVEQIYNYSKIALQRNADGLETAFVIFENEKMVGRIGVHRIVKENKIGEIGYWLVESAQGRGIIMACCQRVIDYGFKDLNLNRIEIKCAVENLKSARIPEKLKFTKEGILREAELLNGRFVDLNLFSLLKSQ